MKHYVFIAQINLEELPQEIIGDYPNKGILYFFIHNDEETMSQVKHKVIFSGTNITDLIKFNPNSKIEFTSKHYKEPFKSYSIEFKLKQSIDYHHLQVNQYESFQEKMDLYNVFDRVSRFGGHHFTEDTYLPAQIIQQKGLLSQEESFFLTRGFLTGTSKISYAERNQSHIDYYTKKISEEESETKKVEYQKSINDINSKIERERQLREGNESYYQDLLDKWKLMIVIDSLDECEMLWWDNSSLEFFINVDDLKNEDFSNTFCLINH